MWACLDLFLWLEMEFSFFHVLPCAIWVYAKTLGYLGGCKDEHDLASENFRLLYSVVGEEMQKAKCGPEAVLKAGLFLV